MVPSLRFLPRWWVILSVLLGVSLSLGAIVWLAVIAGRGGGLPLIDNKTPECPDAFPKRACPAVGLTLLALHCKAANRTAFLLYLDDLFAVHMEGLRRRLNGVDAGIYTAGGGQVEDDADPQDMYNHNDDIFEPLPDRPNQVEQSRPEHQDHHHRHHHHHHQHRQRHRHRNRHGRPPPDTTATMVCYLLVTLLVASAVLAIAEVLRDWFSSMTSKAAALEEGHAVVGVVAPPDVAVGAAGAGGGLGGGRKGGQLTRRCSLVDLTVSRHERRESLAAAQAAVQGHGFAGIGARPPPLFRRSSFPAAPPVGRGPSASSTAGSELSGPSGSSGGSSHGHGGGATRPLGGLGEHGGLLGSGSGNVSTSPRRRPSVSSPTLSFELSDGDSSPDTGRKRIRIIRRH